MTSTGDLWDRLPDGIVVADSEGFMVVVSGVAARLLGRDDLLGKHLSDLPLVDQQGQPWFLAVCPYGGLGTRVGVPEMSWLSPDGAEVLVTTRMTRKGPNQPVEEVALVIRSARGRALLDRERSDLVATVAHELRSPLTGVKGFVATMLAKWDRLNDEQKRLMLSTVHSDASRLQRLITELLDVARIDRGSLMLAERAVDPVVIGASAVESVSLGTSREVVLDGEDGAAEVRADPDKLTQVFANLLENGIRHGEGTVTLRVRESPTPGFVRFEVSDEGEGIEESIRSRVFTKFWTLGTGGGSGLGLYLVHGLVKAHGGTIGIDSAPDGGALIVVDWPIAER